ncbi:MAG: tannase/feruloyl esterase family alpha/beta hydrolase [Anaerolineae bacterium]
MDEPYLTDPRACDFKPGSLLCQQDDDPSQCLTEAQAIRSVEENLLGPVDDQGQHLYIGGMPRCTELKWAGGVVPSGGPMSGSESIASGFLKYLAFKDSPDLSTFNLKNWTFTVDSFNSLREMGAIYNATNPNLAPFRDAGGKLILYHGWADDSIPPFGTITYYQAVQDKMGGLEATQKFARLFMVPGMYHCSGGQGASSFDMLAAMEEWVEKGVAPEKIIATQYAGNQQGGGFANPTEGGSSSGKVVMTRPSSLSAVGPI